MGQTKHYKALVYKETFPSFPFSSRGSLFSLYTFACTGSSIKRASIKERNLAARRWRRPYNSLRTPVMWTHCTYSLLHAGCRNSTLPKDVLLVAQALAGEKANQTLQLQQAIQASGYAAECPSHDIGESSSWWCYKLTLATGASVIGGSPTRDQKLGAPVKSAWNRKCSRKMPRWHP